MIWKVRSSNKMLVLGLALIITGFTLGSMFPFFLSLSSFNRMWSLLLIISIAFSFELGLSCILVIKARELAGAFIATLAYAFLIFFIPVPHGYEEPIYAGLLFLIAGTLVLLDKHKKLQRTMNKV